MGIELDNAAITEAVVERIVDNFMRDENDLWSAVEKKINKKIDALFVASVQPKIQAELDRALGDAFNREYQKTTAWGEPEGEKTSINKELQRLMTDYWAVKVDKAGKETSYGGITRAEWTMAKVTGDDFKAHTERYMIQAAAWLKDGFREQLRAQIDVMLGNLFHVKSAQDAAEGRYK